MSLEWFDADHEKKIYEPFEFIETARVQRIIIDGVFAIPAGNGFVLFRRSFFYA